MKTVTIIIPHWNNYPILKRCILSLQHQTFSSFEVVVIDNNSSDGSSDEVIRQFPGVRLIKSPTNVGFARAVNLGITGSSSPYLVFLNNDVELSPSWLEVIMTGLESNPGAGAYACKLLQKGRDRHLSSAGNLILKSGFGRDRGRGEVDRGQYDRREEVFWASGAACMIPRWLFDKVGLLDEDYFAYFEDIDFGLRAHLQGYSCWYMPEAVGYHVGGATGRRSPHLEAALGFRNALMTVIKDFPTPLVVKYFPHIIFAHLRALIYLSLKGFWKEVLQSEYFLLRNLSRLCRKRRDIQRMRTVPIEMIDSLLDNEDFFRRSIQIWFRG